MYIKNANQIEFDGVGVDKKEADNVVGTQEISKQMMKLQGDSLIDK